MRDYAEFGVVGKIAARAAGMLALAMLCIGLAAPAGAQVVDPGSVVQTIETSLWSPPSPDPSGIFYRPDAGDLMTCDSEVDEMSIFTGVNLWTHSNAGVVSSTATTTPFSSEPTGVAFDPADRRMWIADDNQARIFEINVGPDGVWGSPDDSIIDLDGLLAAGCPGFKDVTYNHLDGNLYVPAGASQLVCEIDPGPNGLFDGATTTGDDVVSTFSLAPHGITDPEGIAYDPFWNSLVIADRGTRDLYEVTPEGGLLRRIDLNFATGGTKPSGVTIAPGSTNPLLRNYFVTDRRMDNGGNPTENDGLIYEIVALPLGGNGAPIVDAGLPQTIEWPATSVDLAGFVSDDGHPYPPSQVLSLWSKQSGPGSVSFGSESSPITTATFSAPGEYVLQLVGDDSAVQTVDTVAITLSQIVTLSATVVGPGSVTLDPPGGSYAAGQTVNVTATPEPDAGFVGWGGDLSGAAASEAIVMDADKSVTASFATLYDVTIQSTGPGGVTLDPPGGSYLAGTVVTATATSDGNALFDGFGGDLSGTANPQLLTVDADKTVSASFTQLYTVNVSATGPGTLTLNPATGPYAAGTIVEVTATPDANAVFDGFAGDLSGTASPQLLTVDADKTVSASFTQHYAVSVSATGPGVVTLDPPGGTYAAGTSLTITALPDPDSAFTGWSGDLAGTTNPQVVVLSGDLSASASFATLFDVSVTSSGPGSVILDPPVGSYAAGAIVSVTAAPDPFAVFDGFGGDLAGSASPQLLSVDADKTVTASFTLPSYTLTVTKNGQGTVTVAAPAGPYLAGSTVTLTAVPASTAWSFGGWSGDAEGNSNPLLLLMDGNKSVHAAFAATGGGGVACGIGPELVALVPALGWLYRRRRSSR